MNTQNMVSPLRIALILVCVVAVAPAVRADGKSQAAKEIAEYVMLRWGGKAVLEGTELLARKIEVAAARHGSEVFEAVRKVGPPHFPCWRKPVCAAVRRHGSWPNTASMVLTGSYPGRKR